MCTSCYTLLPFQQVIVGPEKMIVVPPRHYCVVENPVMRDKDDKPVFDTHGQVSIHPCALHNGCTYM